MPPRKPSIKSITSKLVRKRWRALTVAQKETHLRSRATPAELALHQLLSADPRTRGKFHFQSHVHGCFPDFSFPSTKLIVELDGAVHCSDRARAADARRTKRLTNCGWKVVRMWNSELRNPDEAIEKIVAALNQPVILPSCQLPANSAATPPFRM